MGNPRSKITASAPRSWLDSVFVELSPEMQEKAYGKRWVEMANSRKTFIFWVGLIFVILVIAKAIDSQDPKCQFSTELFAAGACFAILPFPRVRDNKHMVAVGLLFTITIHLISCGAVIMFALTGKTFWYTYDVIPGYKQELAAAAVHISGIPLLTMFAVVQFGFSHRTVICAGCVLVLAGTAALVCLMRSLTQPHSFRLILVMVVWSLCPNLFGMLILSDNERHTIRAKALAQKELEQQQVAAANQQRTVGYIFHEVRNPINNIVLACELMRSLFCKNMTLKAQLAENSATQTQPQNTDVMEEICQMIDDIHQSAGAAVRVLNDALNLQKLQSGSFEFVHKSFELDELVLSSTRMVQPQMKSKNIEIKSVIDLKLKAVAVIGDFHRLQQVLLNYLSNAYKFTPQNGTVEVRMSQIGNMEEATAADGTKHSRIIVRTSVFNTGEPIKPEDRERLFRPWSQIRAGDQQQGQGSGLGLALCKAFVEKGHHGTVGVESECSSSRLGTEFFFEIPFELSLSSTRATPGREQFFELKNLRESKANTSSTSSSIMALGLAMGPLGPITKESSAESHCEDTSSDRVVDVLIVEDSAMSRRLLAKTLGNMGVSCDQTSDGVEAVKKIQQVGVKYYSVIFMDKEMPNMDGYEATRKLREMGYSRPIVGCTGNVMDNQVEEFLQVGVNHVISKPVTQEAICVCLQKLGVSIA